MKIRTLTIRHKDHHYVYEGKDLVCGFIKEEDANLFVKAVHQGLPRGLDDWQREIGAWGAQTFGIATPSSILAHLKREVQELIEEQQPEARKEEAADVLHLLIQLAYREGWSLQAALSRKFEINKTRQWGEPDEEGVVEHLR